LIRNIGVLNKVPLAVLSLQNTEQAMVERIWAAEFGWGREPLPCQRLDVETIATVEQRNAIAMLRSIGFEDPIQRKIEFKRLMNEASVWIEHDYFLTMDEVVSRMERLKKTNNVKVIVIDGLDMINAGVKNAEQTQAMQKLVQAAERLKVALLLTSELNREVEYRVGNRPSLCNLRGGFNTEILTSTVMFIFRPEYYGIQEDEMGNTEGKAELIVAKNAIGATGNVRVNFVGRSRFEDIECPIPVLPSKIYSDGDDLPY
jgi:replicative DNA helicase